MRRADSSLSARRFLVLIVDRWWVEFKWYGFHPSMLHNGENHIVLYLFFKFCRNYSLLQQAFRRKSVFSDEVFRRKSVFFSWSFRRKSVFLQWKNQRKSVDMLYRKIEKYIVTHLQSESDKILIVDGSYGKLRVSLCWTGGARVLPFLVLTFFQWVYNVSSSWLIPIHLTIIYIVGR